MSTKKQVEEAIFKKEGFYVHLQMLDPQAKGALPDYEWEFMASNKWKISDWKNERMRPYLLLVKSVDVFRGDDTVAKGDPKLGNLRDSYFDAEYGKPE